MSNLRYFYLSIFLIGLFWLSIPQICSADISVGFLSPPLLIIVAFMGVWIIEALTIKDKLKGAPQKALFTALVANLVTGLLGFLIILSLKEFVIIKDVLPYEFIILIATFLLTSIIIEAVILYFYYRQESWSKIFGTSLRMHLKSYLFLIVFLIADFMVFGVIDPVISILIIVIVPYFFLKTFELLTAGRKLSRFSKAIAIFLILTFSFALCAFIFIRAIMEAPRKSPDTINAGIIANMNQIRTQAELIYSDEGSYAMLTCTYNDKMEALCNDIKKNTETEPIIHTSQNEYCAYVKLFSVDKYYCIAGWKVITTPINPSTSGYCDGKTFICPPGEEY